MPLPANVAVLLTISLSAVAPSISKFNTPPPLIDTLSALNVPTLLPGASVPPTVADEPESVTVLLYVPVPLIVDPVGAVTPPIVLPLFVSVWPLASVAPPVTPDTSSVPGPATFTGPVPNADPPAAKLSEVAAVVVLLFNAIDVPLRIAATYVFAGTPAPV